MNLTTQSSVSKESLDVIYGSALEGRLFENILDIVFKALPSVAISIFAVDSVNASGNFILHRGLPKDAATQFAHGLAVDNPWIERQWQMPVGAIYQDDDLLSRKDLGKWSKFANWEKMLGALTSVTGVVLDRVRSRQVVLEVRYASGQSNELRRQVTDFLTGVSTHLSRALRILHLQNEFPIDSWGTTSLLQLVSFSVFVIDADCRVRNMNDAAQAFVSQMETFFISAGGTLNVLNPESDIEFRAKVKKFACRPRSNGELFSVLNETRTKRVFVTLKRLTVRSPGRIAPDSRYELSDPLLVLSIHDTEERLSVDWRELSATFRLTSAETELASKLLDGDSIGEIACRDGLSKQTLRNQLTSIMRKTSTSRQSELVALLTRLALFSPG